MNKQANDQFADIRLTDSLERSLLQRALREEVEAQRAEALKATFRAVGRGVSHVFKSAFEVIVEARKLQARAALRGSMARSGNLQGKQVL